MRDNDLDLVIILGLVIWSEVRQTRLLAAVSAAKATQDPFTFDALKGRAVDQGLNSLFGLVLP